MPDRDSGDAAGREAKEDNVPLLAAGVAFPALVEGLGLGRGGELAALAVVSRQAPDRANPRWRWVSRGAVVALVLWLLGSVGFSYHVENFGKHHQTYGARPR